MSININGTIFQSSNTALNISTNSLIALDNYNGIPIQPHRPYFVATDNGGWYNYVSASWQDLVFNTVIVDNLSNYSPTTGAFTAPVSGTYHFQSSTYSYKNPSTNADSYVHPMFLVNGSYTGDTQVNEIFYLTAGDYVNVHHYASQPLQWNGASSFFSGYLIG